MSAMVMVPAAAFLAAIGTLFLKAGAFTSTYGACAYLLHVEQCGVLFSEAAQNVGIGVVLIIAALIFMMNFMPGSGRHFNPMILGFFAFFGGVLLNLIGYLPPVW